MESSHGVPHLQFASWVFFFSLAMFQLETSTLPAVFGQEMLQSRVQPSNITFSILVKLHFEAATAVCSFLGLLTQRKHGIFRLILRFQTLHHLEILDIPKRRACKCTKSEGYYGSEEWMMSLLEQMCSSISRHVVSFFQLSSFSCSTGWANRWSFSLGTHPPHGAFSTETLKDSHLMIESHVIKDNFTIKCCSGHELLYLTLMHGRNTS